MAFPIEKVGVLGMSRCGTAQLAWCLDSKAHFGAELRHALDAWLELNTAAQKMLPTARAHSCALGRRLIFEACRMALSGYLLTLPAWNIYNVELPLPAYSLTSNFAQSHLRPR